MYHEIQAEDEIHSKKSASTGSSSAIKSRSRVKSMSKHDQFIRLTHFLFAIKSGLGGDWTYFLLLFYFLLCWKLTFTVCLIPCLNFMVHIQYTFFYFSANKKYPLFSILLSRNPSPECPIHSPLQLKCNDKADFGEKYCKLSLVFKVMGMFATVLALVLV